MSAGTGPVERQGRVICGATAANCICTLDPDHDPPHVCGRNCTGQWTGEHGTASFEVVAWPFPKGG